MSYFQKTHVYACAKFGGDLPICENSATSIINSGSWDDVPLTTGCYDSSFIPSTVDDNGSTSVTGACLFRPGAQVLDNWGWCNGDCEGAGQGCYNDPVPGAPSGICDDTSQLAHPLAYTRFDGIIVVIPQ